MKKFPSFLQRHAISLAALFIVLTGLTLWFCLSPKMLGRFEYARTSPDGRYRLETWGAYYYTSNDYGFVKLYDTHSGRLMCESPVAWLTDNGRISWTDERFFPNEIRVGMNIELHLSDNGSKCIAKWVPN